MAIEIENFDEVIEIDYSSTLLIRIVDHPWIKTLELIQVFRSSEGIIIHPSLRLPVNRRITFLLSEIQQFVKKYQSSSPSQEFREWLHQETKRGTSQSSSHDSLSLPKKPPAPSQSYPTLAKPHVLKSDLRKAPLIEHAPIIAGAEGMSQPPLEPLNDPMLVLSPDRLEESIPNSKLTVNDLIYAIVHNQPFAQRIDVPEDQIKLVLYYAFMGKRLITMNIEKEIMRHNIFYNYMNTGRLLKEMADQGLVEMEERVAKKSGYRYYLWKFTGTDNPKKKK